MSAECKEARAALAENDGYEQNLAETGLGKRNLNVFSLIMKTTGVIIGFITNLSSSHVGDILAIEKKVPLFLIVLSIVLVMTECLRFYLDTIGHTVYVASFTWSPVWMNSMQFVLSILIGLVTRLGLEVFMQEANLAEHTAAETIATFFYVMITIFFVEQAFRRNDA
jgi:hypothetical protein